MSLANMVMSPQMGAVSGPRGRRALVQGQVKTRDAMKEVYPEIVAAGRQGEAQQANIAMTNAAQQERQRQQNIQSELNQAAFERHQKDAERASAVGLAGLATDAAGIYLMWDAIKNPTPPPVPPGTGTVMSAGDAMTAPTMAAETVGGAGAGAGEATRAGAQAAGTGSTAAPLTTAGSATTAGAGADIAGAGFQGYMAGSPYMYPAAGLAGMLAPEVTKQIFHDEDNALLSAGSSLAAGYAIGGWNPYVIGASLLANPDVSGGVGEFVSNLFGNLFG